MDTPCWKSTWLMNIFLPCHFPFNYLRLFLIRIPKGCMLLRGNQVKSFVICYLIKVSKPLLPWKTGNVRFFDHIIGIIKFKFINDIMMMMRKIIQVLSLLQEGYLHLQMNYQGKCHHSIGHKNLHNRNLDNRKSLSSCVLIF